MDPSNETSDAPAASLRSNLADIVENRLHQAPNPAASAAQLRKEHEIRMKFRRLLDPGIIRPNNWDVALSAMKILDTLSGNILRDPKNEKFLQFKPTNSSIQAKLIQPKGSLEYAVEMGFRAEVQNFQPLYTFNPRFMAELRIGNEVLHEALVREGEKAERAKRAKEAEKAAKEAAAQKVMLAFEDDRRIKLERDAREKVMRDMRAAAPLTVQPETEVEFDVEDVDGGQTLSGQRPIAPPDTDQSMPGEMLTGVSP